MNKAKWIVAGCALALTSPVFAAPGELGYDSWTRTAVVPDRLPHGRPGYKVTCERETDDCLARARDVCGGDYLIGGWPRKSPRVQALVGSQIAVINSDNPYVIHIACE